MFELLLYLKVKIMTFPIDIHFGSLIIPSHSVFELLAFFIGYCYYLLLKKTRGPDALSPNAEWWIIVGMATGAFVGSRFVAALENPTIFLNSPTWLYYIGGQTIAGGIGGGILGVEIAKKILEVTRKTGDLFVYPLILGIMIGRIGCFLKGVSDGTVGLPSNLPWAFDQGDGIPRHPTSLYEILFLGFLWIVLKRIEKRNVLKEGDIFSVFVFSYSFFRFFEEFLKPRDTLWAGLSSIQLLAGALMVYYVIYIIKQYKK